MKQKAEEFLRKVDPYQGIVILAHDNPDPDAIASGWAVRFLLAEKLGKKARFMAGGGIVRAENKRMMELLKPPLELNNELAELDAELVILVDCLVDTYNHPRIDLDRYKVAVIDHHTGAYRPQARLLFADIRANVRASASITASYLCSLGLKPPPPLATALTYAIRTESKGGESDLSRLDKAMIRWLGQWSDPSIMADIEDAPLSREYFSDLVLALQNVFYYGDTAICFLPQISSAEIVGEVADLLIRCQDFNSVLCAALHKGNIILSVRTDRTSSLDACSLVVRLLDGFGHGGGHSHRAGGIVLAAEHGGRLTQSHFEALQARWMRLFTVEGRRGTRLVAKGDIVRNL